MGAFGVFALALAVASQDPGCVNQASRQHAGYAFIDVNVVPMDRERVLLGRTVLVSGCRIATIGHRDSVTVPAGYIRIEAGDDLFLVPGLVDAHTHLRYENDLTLYAARGVTTVRNMNGDDRHIQWKGKVRSGGFGPRIITAAGTQYDAGWPAGRVRAYVDSVKARGFDFLKVYDGTPAEVYRELVESGKRTHMPIAGHVPATIGLDGVLAAQQQTIEHAEQFVYHWFGSDLDVSRISELARNVKAAGVAVTPTVSVIDSWIAVADSPLSLLTRPEIKWLHPETFAFWHTYSRTSSFENRMIEQFQRPLIRGLTAHDVPILVGTDALMAGLLGPWGVQREIRALHNAGLSRFQALRAATATPASVLRYDAGVVTANKLADLVLLRGNPLDDLSALEKVQGVMVDGVWHDSAELNRRLETIASSYRNGNEFVRLALRGTLGEAIALQKNLRALGDSTRLDAGNVGYVASILRQRGRADDAIRVYELAIEENARNAAAHEGIARAHLATGRVQEAIASLRRALTIDPNRASARSLLNGLSAR